MTKKIKPHQLRPDIMNYNDYYEDIKKRNENKFKEEKKRDARELGMLIRNEQLGERAYIKIATIMQTRSKHIFFKSEDDSQTINYQWV